MDRNRFVIDDPRVIRPGDLCWPPALVRAGAEVGDSLSLIGAQQLIRRPMLAFFCSVSAPGRAVVEACDLADGLARSERVVIGGFQSPVEREVLNRLLGGTSGIVICAARSLRGMTLRPAWAEAMRRNRLLLLSAAPDGARRPTRAAAEARNRIAAALASRVLLLHASPGGSLWSLAREITARGTPLDCIDHPANADLLLLGAKPLRRHGMEDG